jgi:putative transposase
MPRVARIVIPEIPYHITQRGNNRQDVFFVESDRRVYLELLQAQSERYGLAVMGYCLMSNHIHLVAVPAEETSLAKAVGRTNFLYTQYINRLHGRSGHLWQNRFYSCGLDDDYFWRAIRYVERNPVRARLVKRAWEYPWSSAAGHIEGKDDSGLLAMDRCRELLDGQDWKRLLTQPEDETEIRSLRTSTNRGRPLGSDRFLSKLERLLGRRVRAMPVGRPKKKKNEDKSRKGKIKKGEAMS